MGAVVTYPGWGPFRLFPLSNGQCDDLNDALWVCKQGISSLHRIRVDYDHNLVTVDLDRRSGFKTEQSIIDYLFGCLKDYELEMSVVVAVRNRSCVPSIAFVGVNPSTNRWEYLKDIPRLIDDNTGRSPYEVNHHAVDPGCRRGHGYRPYHAPGGISPRCSIPELNSDNERVIRRYEVQGR